MKQIEQKSEKPDGDYFELYYASVSQKAFDLLLIVVIDVTLLAYLYKIMHWLSAVSAR